MITCNGPVFFKTKVGTVAVYVSDATGEIAIHTFQSNGEKRYELKDNRKDAELVDVTRPYKPLTCFR